MEAETQMRMTLEPLLTRAKDQPAAHAQMDVETGTALEAQPEPFALPADRHNLPFPQRAAQGGGMPVEDVRPAQVNFRHPPPRERARQPAYDCFNFRKFRQ